MPDNLTPNPKLTNVHPVLVAKIERILTAMDAIGFPMKVVQGVRGLAEQQALYAKGRTLPGPKVTNCDGVIKKSNHQEKADGYGHAVDCAFQGPQPYAETHPWKVYGALVEALGLKWGGGAAFRTAGLNDRPHAELIPSPELAPILHPPNT